MKSMGSHQCSRMQTDVWLTPPAIIRALGPFDLDPCCPLTMPWKTAGQSFALPLTDGLQANWFGRVWLNPPYSREAVKWLDKLATHGHGTALIFARTETSWFRRSVWRKASAILFMHGRVSFHHLNGEHAKANSGAPSCLVAYGEKDAALLKMSSIAGTYVDKWKNFEL